MEKLVKKNEYLKEFANLENEEFQKTWDDLGDHSKWIIEIFVLIQTFEKQIISNLNLKWRPINFLIQLVFKEIHLCFMALMRKHSSQAFSSMRSAIEATGFINAIKDDTKKSEIWLKRELFDMSNQEYRDLLKEGWNGTLGSELKEGFNLASEKSHANLVRMMHGHTSTLVKDFEGNGGTINDKFSFFDEPENENWLRSETHWLILMCFNMLFQISEVIGEEVKQSEFYSKLKRTKNEHIEFLKNNKESVILSLNQKNN